MFTIPTSTASLIVANISSLVGDPGLLTLLALVAGVPFGFWVVKRLIGFVPKSK